MSRNFLMSYVRSESSRALRGVQFLPKIGAGELKDAWHHGEAYYVKVNAKL